MSTNEFDLDEDTEIINEDDPTPNPLGDLVPKLVQETTIQVSGTFQGRGDTNETTIQRREFEPLVVTRLGGTLPWDTNSTQLQCGETITDTEGDMNIRLNYECVATQTQFKTLQQMRTSPDAIKLVSAPYSGPVTFDELKFDQVPDANGAVLRGGRETNEPIYTIQLQSKENTEGENGSSN